MLTKPDLVMAEEELSEEGLAEARCVKVLYGDQFFVTELLEALPHFRTEADLLCESGGFPGRRLGKHAAEEVYNSAACSCTELILISGNIPDA